VKDGQFDLSGCQKLCYRRVKSWFLNIDCSATSKTKVRSVRNGMHIDEVEYGDIQKRLTINNTI